MRKLLTALLLAAAAAPASSSSPALPTRFTQKAQNDLRAGPGPYYPLKAVLGRGAEVRVVKTAGDWTLVRLQGFSDAPLWTPSSALGGPIKPSPLDFFRPERPARMAAASAAVRGFALRYGRAKGPGVDALLSRPAPFSPQDFAAFKAETGAPARKPGAALFADYDLSAQEQGIGVGVAANVAARGLAGSPKTVRYLNLVAANLAEAAGAYQRPFQIYIVAGDEVNAVSVPGGYIFVTKPLLAACKSEAELAAVLAHEMAHLLKRHGLKEMKARELGLKADAAMAELDAESGPAPDDEQQAELNDLAESAYDSVHKPRLQAYELEADRFAGLMLARAGYDPAALPRMIERVGAAATAAKSIEDENPFSKVDFAKRRDAADALLGGELKGAAGVDGAPRLARELKL